jgi:hypothetical protein
MANAITPLNQQNNTQNFFAVDGNWEIKMVKIKPSVAILDGYLVSTEVVASNPTGYATLSPTAQTNGQNIIGILLEKVSATDADYAATAKYKRVLVPKTKDAQARFKVVTGTFSDVDVGRVCLVSADSAGLNVDANGSGARITGFLDSGYGLCTFDVPLVVTA